MKDLVEKQARCNLKILLYVLLWSAIFIIALIMKVILGGFLDGTEIHRAIKALITAIPTGVCGAIGVALQHKLKAFYKRKNTQSLKKIR